jgi:hypothetical protein
LTSNLNDFTLSLDQDRIKSTVSPKHRRLKLKNKINNVIDPTSIIYLGNNVVSPTSTLNIISGAVDKRSNSSTLRQQRVKTASGTVSIHYKINNHDYRESITIL